MAGWGGGGWGFGVSRQLFSTRHWRWWPKIDRISELVCERFSPPLRSPFHSIHNPPSWCATLARFPPSPTCASYRVVPDLQAVERVFLIHLAFKVLDAARAEFHVDGYCSEVALRLTMRHGVILFRRESR